MRDLRILVEGRFSSLQDGIDLTEALVSDYDEISFARVLDDGDPSNPPVPDALQSERVQKAMTAYLDAHSAWLDHTTMAAAARRDAARRALYETIGRELVHDAYDAVGDAS